MSEKAGKSGVSQAGPTPAGEPAAAIAAGLRELGAEMTAYAESTMSQARVFARSLVDAGSLAQVVALQQQFAQANLARLLAGSARVSEIGWRTGAVLFGSAAPHEPAPDEASR